jgi:hypothetical protein
VILLGRLDSQAKQDFVNCHSPAPVMQFAPTKTLLVGCLRTRTLRYLFLPDILDVPSLLFFGGLLGQFRVIQPPGDAAAISIKRLRPDLVPLPLKAH